MKVGVLLPSRFEDPGEFLADARAMEAAGVDSVWMEDGDGDDPMLALAAIAAVTAKVRLGLILPDAPSPTAGGLDRAFETLQHLSQNRVITLFPSPSGGLSGIERWRRVELPTDRDAWARTLEDGQSDFDGVIVPLDPRLLDILRHPEEAIDRSDLMLAQG